jgi:hypothetical protein
VCECSAENLRRSSEPLPNQNQLACLWEIDCECAHEGCKRHSSIYTYESERAAASDIVGATIAAEAVIACTSGHDLVLVRERMQAKKLDY